MAAQAREIWKDEETRLLVKVRVQYDHLFTGSKGNANHGWSKVITELQTKYNVVRNDRKKYLRKWSDELAKYKNFTQPSRKHTGVGTEDDDYFGALDPEVYEILAKYHEPKHNFNPPALLDTSTSTSDHSDHCYSSEASTSRSEYLQSSDIPEEYIEDEVEVRSSESDVEVTSENVVEEDVDVSVKASSSKRCADFYKAKEKKVKKEKPKEDDWLNEYLLQARQDRKQEWAEMMEVFKNCQK
ncbi:Trihelix transcription factor GT-4 [Frankliniella fusca]|uniref:Trihelix transcription factor GT-4 n=1 Tax=Frankliniella fusca TaxID=407009 RepID=A0AAE1LME7_9NEOP|nr:Trihelix transcription factor GT-4 [Frankliniella fusca]